MSFSRFRGCWSAIGGTLVCALVVGFLDVVSDGSCLCSAMICPIWLVVAVVRSVLQRPGWGVAGARIFIPIVTLLLAVANYRVQKTIAVGNAALLIEACEQYRANNGSYPKHLKDLVPRYLRSVPRAKYCCLWGEFAYFASNRPLLLWYDLPPFGRWVYNFEKRRWRYLD
ncbi:MAG TPA: hypothetical protein VF278_21515 [Pirellulales bacterium]